jgi:hypothetical protein
MGWGVLGDIADGAKSVAGGAADLAEDAGKAFDDALDAAGDAANSAGKAVSNASISDIGHTALDVAGMVPVVGEVADLANAGWYAAEGDYTNAALSAAGAIPFAGNAATAAKWGKKAVDAADLATDVAKAADTAGDVAKAADKAGDAAKAADTVSDAGKATDAAKSSKADDVAAPVSKPKLQAEHVLDGEINPKGKAVGYHHRPGGADAPNARMTDQTAPPDANGIYKGKVEIRNEVTDTWVAKKAESSFYPDNLSRTDIVSSIENAWDNKTTFDSGSGLFKGPSGHGFDIQGYMRDGEIKTAFPLRQ